MNTNLFFETAILLFFSTILYGVRNSFRSSLFIVRRASTSVKLSPVELELQDYKLKYESARRTIHDLLHPLEVLKMEICQNSSAKRNLELINSVEAIAHQLLPEKKEARFETDCFPLEVIECIQERLKKTISIEITNDVEELISLRITRLDFERILMNLIRNSYEAGASIVIVALKQASNHLVISVTDNGSPIEVAQVQKIEDGLSFTTKESGTGLGLKSIKELLKLHQASFSIKGLCVGTKVELAFRHFSRGSKIHLPRISQVLIVIPDRMKRLKFLEIVEGYGISALAFPSASSMKRHMERNPRCYALIVDQASFSSDLNHVLCFPKYIIGSVAAHDMIIGNSWDTLSEYAFKKGRIEIVENIIVIDDDQLCLKLWKQVDASVITTSSLLEIAQYKPRNTYLFIDTWINDINTREFARGCLNMGYSNIFSISSISEKGEGIYKASFGKLPPWYINSHS